MTTIYCCQCERDVSARLTNGAEIYPHRADLWALPFWRCDGCGNYVGCHHQTDDPTRPLGVIATQAIKEARKHIHDILDPLWKSQGLKRQHIYSRLTLLIGRQYHTADIRTIEEAREIWLALRKMKRDLATQPASCQVRKS